MTAAETRNRRGGHPGGALDNRTINSYTNYPTAAIDAFRAAMEATGAGAPDRIFPDGRLHRFRGEGDRPGKANSWYVLHLDGRPAPEWLIALAERPEAEEAPRTRWQAPQRPKGGRYVLRALETELALVAVSPAGRRNEQLNRSAHALFRFVAAGELAIEPIAGGLYAAALHAGLAHAESVATIKSAAGARGVAL